MKMQTQALETFRCSQISTVIRRCSIKCLPELEKLIGLLGSVCITKAVIEQRERQTFLTLEN